MVWYCRPRIKRVFTPTLAGKTGTVIIDREAREIMHLVASVRPSVCLSVRLCALSRLNRLTKSNRSHYESSGVCLCVYNQWAYAGNCAKAVDRRFNLQLIRVNEYFQRHNYVESVKPPALKHACSWTWWMHYTTDTQSIMWCSIRLLKPIRSSFLTINHQRILKNCSSVYGNWSQMISLRLRIWSRFS